MSKDKKREKLSLSIIFALVSMGLFITKILNAFYGKAQSEGASPIIKYVAFPLLLVFAICFIAMVAVNIKNKKAIKENIGDTKYAMKTTKNAAFVLEAVIELISVVIAIVIAYDTYAAGNVNWYDFKYYFSCIILVFTFISTSFYITKTVLKMRKNSKKFNAAKQKEKEKQMKAAERQNQIQAAQAEKARRDAERKAAEKAAMPIKDQSHKPIKKTSKK